MSEPLTAQEVLSLPAMVNVFTAARALGIGRTTAYALVRTGCFPCRVIKIGNSWRVPSVGLRGLLGLDETPAKTPVHPDGSTLRAGLALDGGSERGSTRPPADSTIRARITTAPGQVEDRSHCSAPVTWYQPPVRTNGAKGVHHK